MNGTRLNVTVHFWYFGRSRKATREDLLWRLILRQTADRNYNNVYHRARYCSQPLLFILGLEGTGTFEAIREEVRGLEVRFESQGRPES